MIKFSSSLNRALALAVSVTFCHSAQAGPQILQNSIPAAISHLSASGRLDPQTHLNLSVGLTLRNEGALDTLLGQLCDPASPNYRHYLTQQQFVDQFAPSAADYQTVADYFGTNGFTVVQHSSRMVLDVSGSAANVERVFHVTMRTYQHPTKHRTFFAADRAPSLDLSVPILHVSGLDNYALKQAKIVKEKAVKRSENVAGRAKVPHQSGSGPGGGYMGNDFMAAYMPGVSLTGSGQTVGLLEFDGYYPSDISDYESLAGLSVPVTVVPVDGGVSSPGSGDDEVSLDIEVAMSIAPGLKQIVVYEENPDTNSWEDLLDTMANDTTYAPKQFSCSWGDDAAGAPNVTAENIFKQMSAQGQSFYNAEGDGDAFVGGIPFPEESTNIVQAGGTTLTTTGPDGPPIYETSWDWGGQFGGNNSIGTGGGISENFSTPPWQQGIDMTANEGSATMRDAPDVAMVADNVFVIAEQGTNEIVGGTSCAAPEWAAFTALANQQAAAFGKPSVGFANPAIYATCKSPAYSSYFNDISTGNNFWELSTTNFPAVPGYDLCTGWGTPEGDNLIDLLAGAGDSLGVAPGKGFVAWGPTGGPFTASLLTFTLTNSSASSLNWSLINTSAWLTASSSGGSLAGHTTTHFTVSLNASAYSLPADTYIGGVIFSNQTSHATRMRGFVLQAGQNLVQNGDFEEYPYSEPDWAQTGGIGFYDEQPYPSYNNDFVDDGSSTLYGSSPESSGSQFFVFGTPATVGYISQNIATVPGETYQLSFWLANVSYDDAGGTQDFYAFWNNNAIYSLVDSAATFDWSSFSFNLTATSTNTLLKFGARMDDLGGFWALDTVTLMPLASSSVAVPILSVSRAGVNTLSLSWNSAASQVYQVQYSANLNPPNWINVSTNTATGPTINATVSSSGTQGYYRVLVP